MHHMEGPCIHEAIHVVGRGMNYGVLWMILEEITHGIGGPCTMYGAEYGLEGPAATVP